MINIAVVGFGYWGPNLARCFAEAEGCNLVAIADHSAAALARAGKCHPSVTLSRNWREVVADPSTDAIVIATPIDEHFEICLASLNAGKHVLVEKPMTTSSRQAVALIECAIKRGLVLMVDHTFVYTPAVNKIAQLLIDGTIGSLHYYESQRANLGLVNLRANVMWDLAVHDLAILQFLVNTDAVAVSASGGRHIGGAPENIAHLALFYSNDFIAHLSVNWLSPVKTRQVLIGGSLRMLVYDDLQPSEKVRVYDRGVHLRSPSEQENQVPVSYRLGDTWAPQLSMKEALLTEVEHFLDCIQNGITPTTSASSGLRVIQVLEGACQSLEGRGAPVELLPFGLAS